MRGSKEVDIRRPLFVSAFVIATCGLVYELVAGAMRQALDQLAGLGGQLTPDDVIGRVFSTFCVGK